MAHSSFHYRTNMKANCLSWFNRFNPLLKASFSIGFLGIFLQILGFPLLIFFNLDTYLSQLFHIFYGTSFFITSLLMGDLVWCFFQDLISKPFLLLTPNCQISLILFFAVISLVGEIVDFHQHWQVFGFEGLCNGLIGFVFFILMMESVRIFICGLVFIYYGFMFKNNLPVSIFIQEIQMLLIGFIVCFFLFYKIASIFSPVLKDQSFHINGKDSEPTNFKKAMNNAFNKAAKMGAIIEIGKSCVWAACEGAKLVNNQTKDWPVKEPSTPTSHTTNDFNSRFSLD